MPSDARTDRPVVIVSGTRPEIIKLAPVYFALRRRFGADRIIWVATGQHRELASSVLESFGVAPEVSLDMRSDGDALHQLQARAVADLTELFEDIRPALVLVQGDTISALSGAFAAFHKCIPLGHIEAGLRTHNTHNPYPEEAYRRMIDSMADLRFAPTEHTAQNLRSEKMRERTICVTGNTVIDALEGLKALPSPNDRANDVAKKHVVVVTLHRRESWGDVLQNMSLALADIADANPAVEIVLPLHVNPIVRDSIRPILEGHRGVRLIEPLGFHAFHELMKQSILILTDSGGIQEEAPSYGVPTLVLRESTERPEAIESGQSILVGTDRARIVEAANWLLRSPTARARMASIGNPFGDGRAAERIALASSRFLDGITPLLQPDEAFAPVEIH